MPGAATQLNVLVGADRLSAPVEPAPRRQPVITIRGLSKSFNDTVIYDRFDLDLPQSQFISIFGPNGCGKSTLINMISGLLPWDAECGIFIATGITEWDARRSRIFNSGIMLDRYGEVAIHYHKQFLATHDQNWFSFGERGCPVVDTDLGRIGLLICFDGRIPEIARSLALQGAEIIVDMANFFAMDQADMWGPARSYENGVWLVAATKAGYERSIYYPGGSMIVDPKGRVVAKMPYDRHGVIVADVFPELAHDKSIYAGNDKFADRRPATYGILVENYQDTPVAATAHEPIVPAQAVSKVAAVQMHVTEGVNADDVFT